MFRPVSLLILLFAVSACSSSDSRPETPGDRGVMIVTTPMPEAQEDFDRGYLLCQGFNHDEAVRAFESAIERDPNCAMAWWGKALALGPNINLPEIELTVEKEARAAADRAMSLRAGLPPVEVALIEALDRRYARGDNVDRAALNAAYAQAMRSVRAGFPEDANVGALFAESLLDMNPWNQWSKEGEALPGTMEIVETLEDVLGFAAEHPLANHLYIHTMEASPWPEKALPSAERLARLVPDSGHLVHMPGHIYINLGRYSEAREANEKALVIDNAYFEEAGPQGIYEFYRAHNYHFLTYAAMFEGRYSSAISASRELVERIPPAFMQAMPGFVDGFLAVPFHVQIRFGRWDDVLREEAFGESFPIANALRHYARGVALANLDRHEEARDEQQKFEIWAQRVGPDARIGINPAPPVIVVARHMLAGELLYRSGEIEEGLAELRLAVAAEDSLRYDEPSPWMQPVRHALGALLVESGQMKEAEAVYRADLVRHPANGWALHGLAEVVEARGAVGEAEVLRRRFAIAWRNADIELAASCFCRRDAKLASAAKSCCDD